MSDGHIGMIATPAQGIAVPAGSAWCADNGCFGKGYPGDSSWFAWLASYTTEEISRCAFATAPDVVGDAAATLERSMPWLDGIRQLGYPAAFVMQDGAESMALPWDMFDVAFLGGSTEWKLSAGAREVVRIAHELGKRVHMGRVNSARRLRYADAIGCDSADGTYLAFGPDMNLPKLRGWLRGVNAPTLLEIHGRNDA